MGQALGASVELDAGLELAGIWQRGGDLSDLLIGSDVAIDFSLPEASQIVLDAAVHQEIPLIYGVSGLNQSQLAYLERAATEIAIVFDRNMSLGIAVLERSVREAASSLGPEFEIEVFETHHTHKRDAPSGTALKLGEAMAVARGDDSTDAIQYSSERRGDVPGDHEVKMSSPTEQLIFSHSVTTRQVFVDGALQAARWVLDRPPGLYSMQDVLFSYLK
ncbi:MAG: 4-hydroxy-tetrahydrodipicolinate reductase [Gammaproteobacteria bacterium]|jgi:4-hydroxy-tetrahydrodipicolinate reductase|nr:4-hydroxy-tetrahydrodipicolinate reductase [Gammaproteobacteria bacterium]